MTAANGLCLAGAGATGFDPRCLAMNGCMLLAMMLPAALPLWQAGATPSSKPIAGYLTPWLIALVALELAQAALANHPLPASLTWASLAAGIVLCLLPWSAGAQGTHRPPAAMGFRDGAKRGCRCLGANFGALMPMAVLGMSPPAFIAMAGSMAACQIAKRKFSGPLMALALSAGFLLSALSSPL